MVKAAIQKIIRIIQKKTPELNLEDYDVVLTGLKSEINNEKEYRKKIVELELELEKNSNFNLINGFTIPILLAFFVDSIFSAALNGVEGVKLVGYAVLAIVIVVFIFTISNEWSRLNNKNIEIKQKLLILQQEKDFLTQNTQQQTN